MRVFYPPENTLDSLQFDARLFLAGSIEMGKAKEWQQDFLDKMKECSVFTAYFNPRRKDWDSSWEQKIENPHFFQQVTWELDNLDRATNILFYFQKETKSPITLLELGLYAHYHGKDKKLLVVCEEGFWRKGNVDIVCNRYNIPQESLIEMASQYYLNN